MSVSTDLISLRNDLEPVVDILASQRFRNREGLGNEVPFFIAPFAARETAELERFVRKVSERLLQQGITVTHMNLYDLVLEILEERGILETILEREPELEKDELKELLQSVLDMENHFVPAIEKRVNGEQTAMLLLTGVGEVFPYIRSHNLLNNLQKAIQGRPTVMFFPGKYQQNLETGASLNLFEKLGDDRYYRAFHLFHALP